VLYY